MTNQAMLKRVTSVILLLVALLMSWVNGYSQNDTLPKTSHFRLTSYYLSNAVYSGRKDSLTVPYLKTSISYLHKSGFTASAGFSALVKPANPITIDAFWLDAGYEFTLGGKFNGGINLTKTFYSDASFSVSSEIKGEAGAYLGYDAGIVSINTSAYAIFSQSTDISSTLGLSHLFTIEMKDNALTIEPSFTAGFGTRNFYEAYFKNRKFATTGTGKGHSGPKRNNTSPSTITIKNSNGYGLLDYETALMIKYESLKWGLYINPTYAVPVNPTSYILNNITKTEHLTNSFYFELGGHLDF